MKLDPAIRDQVLATVPSLRAFAISLCGNIDRADDLVQETLLRALAHIDSFQPGTNMPAWLFTILRNLFRSEYRKRRREVEDAEGRYLLEPSNDLTAEKIYDARWAIALLGHAVDRLRHRYAQTGEESRFEVLKIFIDMADGRALPSYEQVAESLRVSIGAAKTLIHRFRKQYAVILREEIGRTVSDPAEIEEEIHALCDALIVTEGRL